MKTNDCIQVLSTYITYLSNLATKASYPHRHQYQYNQIVVRSH